MKATKKSMVKEIFFDATQGKRTDANFVDGMYLLDVIPAYLPKDYIEWVYARYKDARIDARHALSSLVDGALENNIGTRGRNERYYAIRNSYKRIFA
jgi:hypothetical protein